MIKQQCKNFYNITESDNIFVTYLGDTFERERVFLDSNNNPIDLTGATVFFTVKKNYSDTDSDAIIAKQITSFTEPTLGKYKILIELSENLYLLPGKYYCDIKIKQSNNKITTDFNGFCVFKNSVTLNTN